MIVIWRGKNVDDLTRDEAIASLKECAQLLEQSYKMTQGILRIHRDVAERRTSL